MDEFWVNRTEDYKQLAKVAEDLKQHPDRWDLYEQKTELYLKVEDYGAATKGYQFLIDKGPAESRPRYQQGVEKVKAQELQVKKAYEAIDEINKAMHDAAEKRAALQKLEQAMADKQREIQKTLDEAEKNAKAMEKNLDELDKKDAAKKNRK